MIVSHDTFSLERRLAAPPARVFRAWADPALKRRWFVDHDGPDWTTLHYSVDFRVGGRERGAWEMARSDTTLAGEHANESVYIDIVPDARIVYAYTMAMNGDVHSASLSTVTFEADGDGCRLTYTEQGAFFESSDGVEMRRGGWSWLLDALERELMSEAAS